MNVLITGNLGYVGPVLAKALRTLPNIRLLGLDNAYFASCITDPDGAVERLFDLQYYRDIRDICIDDFQGVDAVVHLAAISNDPMGNYYTLPTCEINYGATVKTAMLAKAAGVAKFIFASSCSVYGFSESGVCDESSPVNPLTEYARTKVLSERFLESLANEHFQVTCFRFATACGASPRLRLDLVLNDFVASAITTGKIEILSDGTPWRPLIDVKNMASAIKWALTVPHSVPYQLLNAGSDSWNFQIKELAATVAEGILGTKVCINPEGQPDKRSYKVNFDAFVEKTGIDIPQTEIRRTIDELAESLRKRGFADSDFRKSQYMRLNVLKKNEDDELLDSSLRWRPMK